MRSLQRRRRGSQGAEEEEEAPASAPWRFRGARPCDFGGIRRGLLQKARLPALPAIWLLVFRFRAWGLPVFFSVSAGRAQRQGTSSSRRGLLWNKGLHAGPHLCFDFDFLLAPLIIGARFVLGFFPLLA